MRAKQIPTKNDEMCCYQIHHYFLIRDCQFRCGMGTLTPYSDFVSGYLGGGRIHSVAFL